jgi:predicted transcriptional regulator
VRDKPKTVPEMAELIGLPSHEVLWHVAALKKYGILEEAGACGMYYLYQPTEEARK